jgi:hypothetical protein
MSDTIDGLNTTRLGEALPPPNGQLDVDAARAADTLADRPAKAALEVYRLVSIEGTSAPAPGVGDDWLVYRIARGTNVVTGYRRGTRASVTLAVERIMEGFNERLLMRPRRVHIQLGKTASKPRRVIADKITSTSDDSPAI